MRLMELKKKTRKSLKRGIVRRTNGERVEIQETQFDVPSTKIKMFKSVNNFFCKNVLKIIKPISYIKHI